MRTDPAVPRTMHASVIDGFGGAEKLVPRDVPVPQAGPHQVLVRVDTAGVGIWDVKARRGEWSSGDDTFPMILGADGSGTIAGLGEGVERLQLGDSVYGYLWGETTGGFYAEYVVLDVAHVAPMPSSLDFREAGGVAATGITALAGIDDVLAVRTGQTILVHGATGGVGTLAVQFAKRRGARVLATARGADGVQLLHSLGVDEPIDVQHEDCLAIARRVAPDGLDGVLALASGPVVERCAAALRYGGRLAYPNGVAIAAHASVDARAFDGIPSPEAFTRLSATIDAGPFTVPIGGMFSLDDAAEAHRHLERGHVLGKVVLTVDVAEDAIEKVA